MGDHYHMLFNCDLYQDISVLFHARRLYWPGSSELINLLIL